LGNGQRPARDVFVEQFVPHSTVSKFLKKAEILGSPFSTQVHGAARQLLEVFDPKLPAPYRTDDKPVDDPRSKLLE
jgi:hypothetical protein